MALNSMGLGITLTATDAMSGVLQKVERAFTGMKTSSYAATAVVGAGLASMAAGIALFAGGLGGLEMAFGMAGAAATFTAAIQRAGMVAEGVAGQSLKLTNALREAAMVNAMATGFDPTQIAAGLESIAAMGFNASQSIAMIRPALDLAAGGGISVASSAAAMTSAIKVFGYAASDAGDVADKLKGIADFTGLEAKDLEISLGTVGRGAGMAKQNLDEMLISMGLVKNTGVDATVAASSVSSALIFMAKNADKFKKIGVNVEDANGKFRDFGDVVLDVGRVMDGSTKGDAAAIKQLTDLFQRFGVTAFQGVYGQLKAGVLDKTTGATLKFGDALAYMRQQMTDASDHDRSSVFADAMLGTFEGLSKRIDATMEVIKISVGEGFEGLLQPALRFASEVLGSLGASLMKMSPAAKQFAAGLFIAASAMAVATGAALILTGAIAAMGALIFIVGTPMLAFFGMFLAIAVPMMTVAVALTGTLLAFGAGVAFILANDIGGSAAKLKAEFSRWKLIFESVVGFLSEGKLTGALAEEFSGADAETQGLIVKLTLFGEKVKRFATEFYENLKVFMAEVKPILGELGESFMGLGRALGIIDERYGDFASTLTAGGIDTAAKDSAKAFAEAFKAIATSIKTVIDFMTILIEDIRVVGSAMSWLLGGDKGVLGGSSGILGDLGSAAGWLMPQMPAASPTSEASGDWGWLTTPPWEQDAGPGTAESSPAVADASSRASASDGAAESLAELMRNYSERRNEKMQTIVVQSVLDGRVIAESVVSVMEDDRLSSFSGGPYSAADQ